jgi:Transcription termination factor nusG
MSWYAVRTKPQKESQAAAILEQRGLTVYLPLLKKRKVRAGTRAQDPLFPCYLFAEVDVGTDAWLAARSAPYVNYFLGQRGVPTELPAAFVTALCARVDVENTSGSPPLRVGRARLDHQRSVPVPGGDLRSTVVRRRPLPGLAAIAESTGARRRRRGVPGQGNLSGSGARTGAGHGGLADRLEGELGSAAGRAEDGGQPWAFDRVPPGQSGHVVLVAAAARLARER